jgi:hypothetical protein
MKSIFIIFSLFILLNASTSCAVLKNQSPQKKTSKIELPPDTASNKYSRKRNQE